MRIEKIVATVLDEATSGRSRRSWPPSKRGRRVCTSDPLTDSFVPDYLFDLETSLALQRRCVEPGLSQFVHQVYGVVDGEQRYVVLQTFTKQKWRDPDSNRGHHDFQSC